MEVTSGSEWTVSGGPNKRYFAMTLDEVDGKSLNEEWDSMDWRGQTDWLQKRTDLEVLAYMFREGAITQEFFKSRAEQIRDR